MPEVTISESGKETMIEVPSTDHVVESKPTVQDAQEADISTAEIEMGKKLGVLEDAPGTEKEEPAKPAEPVAPPKPVATKTETKPWEKNIPSEELAQVETFNPNEKAQYWKAKREKYRRQEAEAQRDQARIQVAHYKALADERGKAAPAPAPAPAKTEDEDPFSEVKPADKDKPVTEADLERRDKAKADALAKAEADQRAFMDENTKALTAQEEDFKADHDDYDSAVDNAEKLYASKQEDLMKIFPDKLVRRGVITLIQELEYTMKNAANPKPGMRSAAEVAYELGQAYPKAKASNTDEDDEVGEKGSEGSATPLEKRLDQQERPSSASLSGGSNRRLKSVESLTAEDLAEMDGTAFANLRRKHPEVVEKILRQG